MRVALLLVSLLTILGIIRTTSSLAAPSETMYIWRAQIRLTTGTISHAGSDSSVRVRLNSGNSTWIDYGRNDFERGDTFTYDLKLDSVSRLSHITMLQISKTGSDGWCIRAFDLLINGRTIYSASYSPCHWLDNEEGYSTVLTVSSSSLRSSPAWTNYTPPFPPSVMPRSEIESRVEAIVGDAIYGRRLYWGKLHGRAVEAWRQSSTAVHIDLDLAMDIRFWPDPEVDVDLNLVFSCANGQITIRSQNVNVSVDSRWYQEVLSGGIILITDEILEAVLQRMANNLRFTTGASVPICPTITVQSDGSVRFSL